MFAEDNSCLLHIEENWKFLVPEILSEGEIGSDLE